jgi:hypothetical protein
MSIEPVGNEIQQTKVNDVPRLQPRETVEPDRDADDRLARARMEESRVNTRTMESQEGMGNTVDTTA